LPLQFAESLMGLQALEHKGRMAVFVLAHASLSFCTDSFAG